MVGNMQVTYYDSIPLHSPGDIMDIVGQKGRWQFRISAHIFFVLILVAIHAFSLAFLAPNLDHWCSNSSKMDNFSVQERKDERHFYDKHCFRYDDAGLSVKTNNVDTVRMVPCSSWEYDDTFYTSSLLSKWNLVCNRMWLLSLTKSIFMGGFFVSVVLFGYLSDRYGRKPIIISTSILTTVFTVSSAFCSSVIIFIITRFFVGLALGGFYSTAFKLLMEIVVPEMKTTYSLGIQFGWSLGFICLPGLAWFVRDSFWLQITLAVPSFIHMLLSWMIPESPRWLLSKGKAEEAEKILIEAMETNSLKDAGIEIVLEKMVADSRWEDEGRKRKTSVFKFMRIPGYRRLTVFLCLIWFIISFIYFGLSLNTNELKGNLFLNFFLSGIVEFPAYWLSIYIVRSFGKRRSLVVTLIARGIICLFLYLIPIDIPETILAAAIIGKFFITCSAGILLAFTEEIFPMATVARHIGIGSSTIAEGFGSIAAPFVNDLGHATHPAIPQFLFGILSIACGGLVIFLPETENIIIPDPLEGDINTSGEKVRGS